MKKMPASKRSQHQGLCQKEFQYNHTLKIAKKPLSNIELYELLRKEFKDNNPDATDLEILTACIGFANDCGLSLSKKLLEINLHRLGVKYGD